MPSMHIIDISLLGLGASVAVGAIVGLQREYKRNSAGFRTHMLVAIGACIAMMTNEYLLLTFGDVSKVGRCQDGKLRNLGYRLPWRWQHNQR